jgi:hypothetical protein
MVASDAHMNLQLNIHMWSCGISELQLKVKPLTLTSSAR